MSTGLTTTTRALRSLAALERTTTTPCVNWLTTFAPSSSTPPSPHRRRQGRAKSSLPPVTGGPVGLFFKDGKPTGPAGETLDAAQAAGQLAGDPQAEINVLRLQLAAAKQEVAALKGALDIYAMAESAVNQNALFGTFLGGGSSTPLFDILKKWKEAADLRTLPSKPEATATEWAKGAADEVMGETDCAHKDDSFRDRLAAIILRHHYASQQGGK